MESINPQSEKVIQSYSPAAEEALQTRLRAAADEFQHWKLHSFPERAKLMRAVAALLRARKAELAALMADEMGKVIRDGIAEIEKCAGCCDYYAEHAHQFLQKQSIASDAQESYVAYDPLGVILAIMPWNFPFWQVFRFAAPALMAGNVGVLKHASNVSGCALAIEEVFKDAGFPPHAFSTLLVESSRVEALIRNPLVSAVTLTGSTPAGRSVAGTLVRN